MQWHGAGAAERSRLKAGVTENVRQRRIISEQKISGTLRLHLSLDFSYFTLQLLGVILHSLPPLYCDWLHHQLLRRSELLPQLTALHILMDSDIKKEKKSAVMMMLL